MAKAVSESLNAIHANPATSVREMRKQVARLEWVRFVARRAEVLNSTSTVGNSPPNSFRSLRGDSSTVLSPRLLEEALRAKPIDLHASPLVFI